MRVRKIGGYARWRIIAEALFASLGPWVSFVFLFYASENLKAHQRESLSFYPFAASLSSRRSTQIFAPLAVSKRYFSLNSKPSDLVDFLGFFVVFHRFQIRSRGFANC